MYIPTAAIIITSIFNDFSFIAIKDLKKYCKRFVCYIFMFSVANKKNKNIHILEEIW